MVDHDSMVNEYGVESYKAQYSENECNRFENLEGIEGKILNHFLFSQTRHAQNIWKILKNDVPEALNCANLTPAEKINLVFINDTEGEFTTKRFFMQPFVDDAWSKQCSSVYVYVDEIHPSDYARANVIVTVEVVVHSRISVLEGNPDDGDEARQSSQYNPNDFNKQGDIVVAKKNRATVLLKSIIAELNGLYLDGIGYLLIDPKLDPSAGAKLSLWNSRSFYGYTIKFAVKMGNISDNPNYGY